MQTDVSFERRLRYQDKAIVRLMCEARLLRDENAQLRAQLDAARRPGPAATKGDRLEATLPAGPGGPATARAALTRWLTGRVPGEVLSDARLLASELLANSAGIEPPEEAGSVRFGAQLRDGALRVEVRDPSRSSAVGSGPEGSGFGLQLVQALASRWGGDEAEGTHLWFEVDAVGDRSRRGVNGELTSPARVD